MFPNVWLSPPKLYRFWLILLTQHSLERCSRAVLFTFFRNPYMCRSAVLIPGHRDGRFGGGGGHFVEGQLAKGQFEEGYQEKVQNLDYIQPRDMGKPPRPLHLEEDFRWCMVSGATYKVGTAVGRITQGASTRRWFITSYLISSMKGKTLQYRNNGNLSWFTSW